LASSFCISATFSGVSHLSVYAVFRTRIGLPLKISIRVVSSDLAATTSSR